MTKEVEQLKEKVLMAKVDFIAAVNTLNYVKNMLEETSEAYSDSSATSAVRNVIKTYEDYINSKIEFTDKYFGEGPFSKQIK